MNATAQAAKVQIIDALRTPRLLERVAELEAENAALLSRNATLERLCVAGVGLLAVQHAPAFAAAHTEDVRRALLGGEVGR